MHTTAAQIHSYSARNPAAMAAPLPKLTIRPAAHVLGWTAEQVARFEAQRDANNLANLEAAYADARAALGTANRQPLMRRRACQAAALRNLNQIRTRLRIVRMAAAASAARLAA